MKKDKSKVIDLFTNNIIVEDEGVKYSELLESFMHAFTDDFFEIEFIHDMLEFAIKAWNLGNMSVIIPVDEFENMMSSVHEQDVEFELLKKMVAYKAANYKKYNNFIEDFELIETSGDPILKVFTESEESYMAALFDGADLFDDIDSQDEFEENYINRNAIILKPLQPFKDWNNNLYPDEGDPEIHESNVYLVNEDINDLEVWLKKKFDKFFKLELNDWHTNKKEWPQRRNYKMFKQWFQVDVSTMIYDLEKKPVFKSE